MKTCPQCATAYEEDYIFCLNDGKALIEEPAETETVYSNTVPIQVTVPVSENVIYCETCGTENGENSNYCKKCGRPLGVATGGDASSGFGQAAYNEQVPQPQPIIIQPVRRNYSWLFAGIAIIAVLISAITLIGAVVYISWTNPERNAAPPPPQPSANKAGNAVTPANREIKTPANSATQSPLIGRIGHLTTNQRIRIASNRYSEIVGVHYMNAEIEVLDVDSYPTDEGDSTWYRVRVLENGCDAEGILGCGNDLNGVSGQAAMVGWMNARYIDLD
jgi:hypothetical protein